MRMHVPILYNFRKKQLKTKGAIKLKIKNTYYYIE